MLQKLSKEWKVVFRVVQFCHTIKKIGRYCYINEEERKTSKIWQTFGRGGGRTNKKQCNIFFWNRHKRMCRDKWFMYVCEPERKSFVQINMHQYSWQLQVWMFKWVLPFEQRDMYRWELLICHPLHKMKNVLIRPRKNFVFGNRPEKSLNLDTFHTLICVFLWSNWIYL